MYEVIVYSDKAISTRGRRSVWYLIRSGQDVRMAEAVLDAGTDAQQYGDQQAGALFAKGGVPPAKANPLALFYATGAKQVEGLFLGAIFAAFYQLKLGGGVTEMLVGAKTAMAADDAQLAQVMAFEQAFLAADEVDRWKLVALATWLALNLTASK